MRRLNYLRMIYLKSFFFAHEKDAFLLSDLLEDIKRLSELSGLTEPLISNTRTLKRGIIDKFSDNISLTQRTSI